MRTMKYTKITSPPDVSKMTTNAMTSMLDQMTNESINWGCQRLSYEKIESNNNQPQEQKSEPIIFKNNSTTSTPRDAHFKLFREIMPIVNEHKLDGLAKAFRAKKYSQALRMACTISTKVGFQLVQLLMEYRTSLNINPNEKSKTTGQTALHHAAIHNKDSYYFLVSHNLGDEHIPDNNNQTPWNLLNTKTLKPKR
jgi:hypothetical protein